MTITKASQPRLHDRIKEYFPYSAVRPSQGEFINTIYEALEIRSHALLEGSNGLGKTIAALPVYLLPRKMICGFSMWRRLIGSTTG